jgi:hypothetical protein
MFVTLLYSHLPFQEAIFHSVVEHYCFKAASRFPALKPPSVGSADLFFLWCLFYS